MLSLELNHTRDHGYMSIPSINHREIRAFQRNIGRVLSPFQVRCLIAIDTVRRDEWAQHRERRAQAAREAATNETDSQDIDDE